MALDYYCSTTDVYRYSGISSTQVSIDRVNEFIQEAEQDVDYLTQTTYWKLNVSSSVVSGTTSSLESSGLESDIYEDSIIEIHSGLGSGQYRRIDSNTSTTISIGTAWTTVPDNTSTFKIWHTGTNPYKNERYNGDGQAISQLEEYPILQVDSLSIGSTDITTDYVYLYSDLGQIGLDTGSEASYFTQGTRNIDVTYWYGVKNVPLMVKKYVALKSAINSLVTQMGGTFDDLSTFSLGPMSGSIGQAYVNIKSTVDEMVKEAKRIEKKLKKYVHMYA